MWGVFFRRRVGTETFSKRGFFPLPIGHEEEFQSHTQNARRRRSEEHKKRTLSPLCKRKPSATTTQRVVQSVIKDEDV